jgi:outer membrane lipoprotein-sorting protein
MNVIYDAGMRGGSLFLAVMALTVPFARAQNSTTADVAAVIEKTRQTYANLASWQFEHRIVIDEIAGSSTPVTLADITLSTANQGPAATQGLNRAICVGLCRLEWNTATRGRVVLVRDGQATWLYSAARNEFVTGQELRNVASSVSGPMQLSVHVLPLMSFDEQLWTSARLLESEILDVGGERRECYVLDASLKSKGMPLVTQPGGTFAPDPSFSFTASGYLSILSLQALSAIIAAPVSPSAAYVASAQADDFPRVRFWIDKERGLVLRRTVIENSQKLLQTAQSAADAIAVTLRLTDTYTLAKTGSAVPATLFRFQPPADAKQVPRQ